MTNRPSIITEQHLESSRSFFDKASSPTPIALDYRDILAHYYNLQLGDECTVLEIGCGGGELLARLKTRRVTGIDLSPRQIEDAQARVPHGTFMVQSGEYLDLEETFDVIIVSETLNYAADVQQLLQQLHRVARPDTRIIVNIFSSLWRPLVALGRAVGISQPTPQSNWLATSDLRNLLALSGWDSVNEVHRIICPLRLGGLSLPINRWLAPMFPWCCLTVFTTARPKIAGVPIVLPSVSVVIPARNEAGNIEAAVRRTPDMGAWTELIFVEGNSTDNTWAEIQRVQKSFSERRIKIIQQSGRGKGNAVRDGFAVAEGDILMILDADLTMPPEELPKYYNAIASGQAEFANGCRLVYPMEAKAMQFLNLCANKTFGLLFSWLLAQPVKDTLCGTKVLTRAHYLRIAANRAYFGDFDPFGDFDLLFGAAKLNLKIVDIPIRYCERTYGSTNIQRWKHGWLLLRMVIFAARKLRFV